MPGIEIPISGDLAGLNAAVGEVSAMMRQLAATMRQTMAPAVQAGQQVRVSMVSATTGATATTSAFKGMAGTLSNTGAMIANVAAGAKGIRSAFNFLSGLSSGWKKVAVAAAGAGVAIIGVVAAVKVVKASFSSLLGIANGVWRGIKNGAASAASAVKGVFSGIGSAIPGGGMLGPLVGLAGIAGSVALLVSQFKAGADVAGDIEQTSIALEALTGSGATAQKVLDAMRATWVRTGATIEQQGTSIRKFIALGFSPDDSLKLQNNILDVAGAVGMTAAQSDLLASALAQVKAKGIVSMEELRQQIAEKGIPVFEALAAKMGVTQGALIKMVSDGKVPAQALLDIFLNMEGTFGKFVGGANRMGMTFFGLISRLKGAWQLLMAEFAAPIIDSIKPILSQAIDLVGTFKAQAAAAGKVVGNAILSAFALIKSGQTFALLAAGFNVAITGATDLLLRGLKSALAFLATALPPIFEAAFAKLSDPQFWEGVAVFLRGAAAGFSAEIRDGLGQKDLAAALRRQAGLDQQLGSQLIGRAGGVDMGAVTKDSFKRGMEEALKELGAAASPELVAAIARLKELLGTVSKEVAALRASTAVPPANPGGTPTESAPATETAIGALKSAMTLTTSLARVGGGGFGMTFSPMITEQKKSNTLLKQIATNTARSGMTPAIV